MTDLFETPELIPEDIKTILRKYVLDDCTYLNCQELQRELEYVGYTIDWGLDAQPFNLRPIWYDFIATCRETSQTFSLRHMLEDADCYLPDILTEFASCVPFVNWDYEIQRIDGKKFIDIDALYLELDEVDN